MTEPDILYHYTSTQAFVSILERKCLWLSGRHNQNDSNEGRVFRSRFTELATAELLTQNVEKVLKDLEKFEPYLCSLSSKGDLLSQWRGYASNATGVSIGFKRSSLIDIVKGDKLALLRPVNYADSIADLSDENRRFMLALLRSSGTPTDDFRISAAKVVWELKNRAFQEESESRLIVVLQSNSEKAPKQCLNSGATVERKHRAADTGVREYCDLSFHNLSSAISEVIIGPRSDSHIDAVTRLLRNADCNATVRRAEASFR